MEIPLIGTNAIETKKESHSTGKFCRVIFHIGLKIMRQLNHLLIKYFRNFSQIKRMKVGKKKSKF